MLAERSVPCEAMVLVVAATVTPWDVHAAALRQVQCVSIGGPDDELFVPAEVFLSAWDCPTMAHQRCVHSSIFTHHGLLLCC